MSEIIQEAGCIEQRHKELVTFRRRNNPKIDKLARKNSLNQLVDSYICTDYIFFIPHLVTWLKTSILQNRVERLIFSLKSFLFTCSAYFVPLTLTADTPPRDRRLLQFLRQCVRNRRRATPPPPPTPPSTPRRTFLIEKLFRPNQRPQQRFTERLLLRVCVYSGMGLVYGQLLGIVIAFNSHHFPGGLIFLLAAIVCIVALAFCVVYNPIVKTYPTPRAHKIITANHDKRPANIRPTPNHYQFTEKTISKIKLF